MITLQINTAGSWKHMLQFEPARRTEILQALGVFASVLGDTTRWCLLHQDGTREWLREPLSQWSPITGAEPKLLEDVMVSVFGSGDDHPVVFMAYRKTDGEFYISGTCDQVVRGVYAYAPIIDAAPAPAAQKVAA